MADGDEACGAYHEAVRKVCDRARRARWLLLLLPLLLLLAQRVARLRPDGVRRARRRCARTIVLIFGRGVRCTAEPGGHADGATSTYASRT